MVVEISIDVKVYNLSLTLLKSITLIAILTNTIKNAIITTFNVGVIIKGSLNSINGSKDDFKDCIMDFPPKTTTIKTTNKTIITSLGMSLPLLKASPPLPPKPPNYKILFIKLKGGEKIG